MKKLFAISLGGSLIVPQEIDVKYLKAFRFFILQQVKKGNRFIISPGGGRTCRNYQEALKKIARPSEKDLDWIGLFTNNFHAKLLKLMYQNHAEQNIAEDPNKKVAFHKPILVGAGGWRPGRSSDDFSVRLAKIYGARLVINLSNTDYVYDKDPRKFKNPKKIRSISWEDFLKVIGNRWTPGENVPFDPTASRLAKKNKLTVIIANGRNLKNLSNILSGKPFQGTTIS